MEWAQLRQLLCIVIVFLSDGIDGDLVASPFTPGERVHRNEEEILSLIEDMDASFFTIGFGDDIRTREDKELQAMAECGRGKFLESTDLKGLHIALMDIEKNLK
eukprot:RCo023953